MYNGKKLSVMILTAAMCCSFCTIPAAHAAETSAEPYHIAYVGPVGATPYTAAITQGIQEVADEHGMELQMIPVDWTNPQGQVEGMQNMVTLGVDAIFIEPVDANAVSNGVISANEAGIPVFICDTVTESGEITAGYSADNYQMGVDGANQLAELLKEKNGDYTGVVVCNNGNQTLSSQYARWNGFKDTMEEKYPNIDFSNVQPSTSQDDCLNWAANIASKYGSEMDAMMYMSDDNAQVVCNSLKDANLLYPIGDDNHIIMVSFDGMPDGIQLIRNGYLDVSVAQDPYSMGKYACEACWQYLTEGTKPEEPIAYVPSLIVTPENVNDPDLVLWSDLGK